jgi:methionine aminopeptidase
MDANSTPAGGAAEAPKVTTIENSAVADMYKTGADIANAALTHVATLCVPGARLIDLCAAGDDHLNAALAGVYAKGRIEKRIGFPFCVSPNHYAGNLSPTDDADGGAALALAAGDIAKLDCSVVIDGYYAAAATTIVVGAADGATAAPATGRAADVICAAHAAAEAALRLMAPGSTNTAVTDVVGRVAAAYNCTPVQGVLSHVTKRNIIDGNKVIAGCADPEHRVDEFSFEPFEVYHLDVIVSTGDGKVRGGQGVKRGAWGEKGSVGPGGEGVALAFWFFFFFFFSFSFSFLFLSVSLGLPVVVGVDHGQHVPLFFLKKNDDLALPIFPWLFLFFFLLLFFFFFFFCSFLFFFFFFFFFFLLCVFASPKKKKQRKKNGFVRLFERPSKAVPAVPAIFLPLR